jgi:hypothetical protein
MPPLHTFGNNVSFFNIVDDNSCIFNWPSNSMLANLAFEFSFACLCAA